MIEGLELAGRDRVVGIAADQVADDELVARERGVLARPRPRRRRPRTAAGPARARRPSRPGRPGTPARAETRRCATAAAGSSSARMRTVPPNSTSAQPPVRSMSRAARVHVVGEHRVTHGLERVAVALEGDRRARMQRAEGPRRSCGGGRAGSRAAGDAGGTSSARRRAARGSARAGLRRAGAARRPGCR